MEKVRCSVERVNDPPHASTSRLLSMFLSQNGVGWATASDHLDDRALDRAIQFGDKVPRRGLGVDSQGRRVGARDGFGG